MKPVVSAIGGLMVLLLCQACFQHYPEDYFINLQNNSGKYVLPAEGLDYPVDSVDIDTWRVLGPGEVSRTTNGNEKPGSWTWLFPGIQYVSIYVFDGGMFDYEVKGIRNYEKYPELVLLARYDLTLEDLRRLNWLCTYPPDERMKDVHMFPPYSELKGR